MPLRDQIPVPTAPGAVRDVAQALRVHSIAQQGLRHAPHALDQRGCDVSTRILVAGDPRLGDLAGRSDVRRTLATLRSDRSELRREVEQRVRDMFIMFCHGGTS
jgi:hypothetical protein